MGTNGELIRVAVIDASDLGRCACRAAFQADERFELVAEAASAAQIGEDLRLDLVIIDPMANGSPNVGIVSAAREQYTSAELFLLTDCPDGEFVFSTFDLGVHGLASKSGSSAEFLRSAAYLVGKKQGIVSPYFERLLQDRKTKLGRNATPVHAVKLTPKELEILRLMVEGLNDSEIAHRLCNANSTIQTLIARMMNKLSLTNRTQVGVQALTLGLIDRARPIPRSNALVGAP